jgi:predicted nucleic acid-binding protein
MSNIVVDSSVVAKWFIPESDSPKAKAMVLDSARAGTNLIVLDLAFAEVTNVLWKKFRQKLMTADQVRDSLAEMQTAPLEVTPVTRLLPTALEIAMKYDRAVYDALFVSLAQNLALRAVTADERLYNAVHQDFPNIVLLRNW